MRWVSGLAMLAALEACALFQASERSAPRSATAAFTDQECRAVASQRAEDGGANGYDASLQALVARDTYNSCMAMKQNRQQIAAPAPAAP